MSANARASSAFAPAFLAALILLFRILPLSLKSGVLYHYFFIQNRYNLAVFFTGFAFLFRRFSFLLCDFAFLYFRSAFLYFSSAFLYFRVAFFISGLLFYFMVAFLYFRVAFLLEICLFRFRAFSVLCFSFSVSGLTLAGFAFRVPAAFRQFWTFPGNSAIIP